MSARRQLERALRRADARARKRRPTMKVSGKSVFGLNKLIHKK